MKRKILLKAAAILMFIHLAGHTIGHFNWKKAKEPVKQEVIGQMTNHSFSFMGASHSMGDYYEGYGWAGSIAMVFFVMNLWLLSSASLEYNQFARQILITLCICLLAWSLDEFFYFFPFAGILTLATSVLGFITFFQSSVNKEQ